MKQKIANVFLWITFILFVIFGGFIGYVVGDMILDASNMIRGEDIVSGRIGLPLLGIFAFGFIGVFISQYVHDKTLKILKKIWPTSS